VLGKGLRNPQWTVEDVARAFSTELAAQAQSLGLRRV
jgi:hypothetical protein